MFLAAVGIVFAGSVGTGIQAVDGPSRDILNGAVELGNQVGAYVTDATNANESELKRQIHIQVNEIRSERGLSNLSYSSQLERVAEAHSDDMANNTYFSHTSPTGQSVEDRYRIYNAPCRAGGENIQKTSESGTDEAGAAVEIVKAWMNSPGHRENILRGRWTSEAIGVAWGDDSMYVTQNFC